MKPKNASTPESAPAAAEADTDLSQTAADVPESGTSEPESGTPPDDSAPKSMLDAISAGLDETAKREAGEKPADEDTTEAQEGAEGEAKTASPSPDGKKDDKAKPDEKAKPEDDFTPPENLSPRSEGRFKKLVDRTKQAESEATEYKTRWTALESVFQENGIQEEQFNSAVSYMGAVNRGDIAGARQILQQELKALALLSGEEIQAGDPLDDFPDLKKGVEDMELPRAAALELARGRLQNGYQQQQQTQHNQAHQQQQAWENEKSGAIKAIDEFVKDRTANDLDWIKKGPILQAHAVEWCQGLPPKQWPEQIKRMYAAIGLGARQSSAAGNGVPPARPLRGGGMGAGAKPEPRTMHEAMFGTAPNA